MSLANQYISFEITKAFAGGLADGAAVAQVYPSQTGGGVIKTNAGLLELEVTLTTAVQTQLGLIKPATSGTIVGAGAFFPQMVSSEGLAGASSVSMARLATSWSVQPTYAATPLYSRIGLIPGIIGAGFLWKWPDDDPYQIALTNANDAGAQVGAVLRNITGGVSGGLIVRARWRDFAPQF